MSKKFLWCLIAVLMCTAAQTCSSWYRYRRWGRPYVRVGVGPYWGGPYWGRPYPYYWGPTWGYRPIRRRVVYVQQPRKQQIPARKINTTKGQQKQPTRIKSVQPAHAGKSLPSISSTSTKK